MCEGRVGRSLLVPFSIFMPFYADECASLAVDREVLGAAAKEEDENKVLFSGLLKASKYNCSHCNPSWQTGGISSRDTEEEHGS